MTRRKSKQPDAGQKTTEQWIREERTKAISSRENFVAYLKLMYDRGDILPDPTLADSVMVNWRGILDDLWEMARQLGGDHPPPPMPRVEREAEAKSAIDLLVEWTGANTDQKQKLRENPRDKYIYAQRKKGKPWKEIMRAVSDNSKWDPIESEQGVSQAAKRYAELHGKEWPIVKHN